MNGSRHGIGKMKSANGTIYNGQFENDKKHGIGHYSFKNNSSYFGEFNRGIGTGYGIFLFENGIIIIYINDTYLYDMI